MGKFTRHFHTKTENIHNLMLYLMYQEFDYLSKQGNMKEIPRGDARSLVLLAMLRILVNDVCELTSLLI